MKKGEKVPCLKIEALKHETKAPARYTEASLIQKLEKEGVGRPSTYAGIIGTIQDRGYVKKEKNTLIPTFTALVVDRFLRQNFPDYVDTGFTSEMEKDLDDIARGKKAHVKYLKSVYLGSKGLKKLVETQEKQMKDRTFRSLTLKGFEDYSFNVGPFGAYVSRKDGDTSASLPQDIYPGEITKKVIEQLIESKIKGGRSLGKDSKTGREVVLAIGRYGPYVKWKDETSSGGEEKSGKKKKNKKKSKMVSLSPFFNEESITLKSALKLLELPKPVGLHPETKKEIKKGVGRFGPYIVHEGDFRSVPADIFFDIDLKYAVQKLSEEKRRSSRVLKDLGAHPESNRSIQLMKGRFGPYLKHNGKNHSLPSDVSVDNLDLNLALKVIEGGKKSGSGLSVKAQKIPSHPQKAGGQKHG